MAEPRGETQPALAISTTVSEGCAAECDGELVIAGEHTDILT